MRSKAPYIVLAVLFIGYILLEVFGPQPENWAPNYEYDKHRPFSSELVYQGLPDLFPENKIRVVEEGPDDVLREFEASKSNYIIIQDEFQTNQFEAKALIDFVKRGNNVFIAASVFTGSLADSLDVENEDEIWEIFDALDHSPAKDEYLSLNSELDPKEKHFPLLDNIVYNYFPGSSQGKRLGWNKQDRAVFLEIKKGDGSFFLHSVPLIFTNYYMVDPINHEYISKCLSVLPENDIIWDEYYKPGKVHTDSPVSYLLDNRSLKWAWFMSLGGLLLFIVFESKRKQRVIPVLEPPANTTVEFTKTVGRLYFAHGDHKDIAEKKIKHLLEHIRNRWSLPTTELTQEFVEKLSAKSGVEPHLVELIFKMANQIQKADVVEEAALVQLSLAIDDFYIRSK